MKANYHTHTQRCRHAQGTESDYLRCAMDAGLTVLGFSDHAPFPDHDFGFRMPYTELEEHFREVDRLKTLHSSEIIIRKGLEIEYLPDYRSYYEKLLSVYRLDYLLLGEHFYRVPGYSDVRFVADADSTEEFVHYAAAVSEALKTGYFRMLAHPDLYAMDRFAWDSNCEKAADIIIDAAIATGTVLEYNANGYRRGLQQYPDGERYMYPHKRFWQKVKGSGALVIIGSDCHEAKQVYDLCMPKAWKALIQLGIVPLDNIEDLLPPINLGEKQS